MTLNHHLYKIGATDSWLCRRCLQEEETVKQVIINSVAKNEARDKTGLQELLGSCLQSSTPLDALQRCCHHLKVLLRYTPQRKVSVVLKENIYKKK